MTAADRRRRRLVPLAGAAIWTIGCAPDALAGEFGLFALALPAVFYAIAWTTVAGADRVWSAAGSNTLTTVTMTKRRRQEYVGSNANT